MSILRIRDSNGNIQEILAIKGEKGDKGDDYVLTDADKQEIANQILASKQVLPSVTAGDNGKILQVIDGAWGMIDIANAEQEEY